MRTTLPLWLGELLAVQRLGNSAIVNLDLPETLSPRVLNALKADPKSVDMRALAQHFYGLAARVLDLFEEEEIVDILTEVGQSTGASRDGLQRGSRLTLGVGQTFKKRAAEIADHAHNPRGALGEGAEFLRGLDEMERQRTSLPTTIFKRTDTQA